MSGADEDRWRVFYFNVEDSIRGVGSRAEFFGVIRRYDLEFRLERVEEWSRPDDLKIFRVVDEDILMYEGPYFPRVRDDAEREYYRRTYHLLMSTRIVAVAGVKEPVVDSADKGHKRAGRKGAEGDVERGCAKKTTSFNDPYCFPPYGLGPWGNSFYDPK